MLTEFQQGRQSRVGQPFAVELQDFMKANAWKACAVVESIKIGKCLVRSLYLLRVGPVQESNLT